MNRITTALTTFHDSSAVPTRTARRHRAWLALLMVFLAKGAAFAQLSVAGNRLITGVDIATASPQNDANLGRVLATGDFDGNGRDDLVLGLPLFDWDGREDAGTVEVLYRAGSSDWLGEQIWHQDMPGVGEVLEAGDRFGGAVTTGDFNGDGYADLAIGAPGERLTSSSEAGVVHVAYGSVNGLLGTTEETLTRGSVGGTVMPGAEFGAALAAGDFDSDGYDDLAIGVPGEDVDGHWQAGVVVVVQGSPGGLDTATAVSLDQDLLGQATGLDEASREDRFGSVLVTGDFDGDHHDDLAIGVPLETLIIPDSPVILDAGAVNVVMGAPAGLDPTDTLFLTATPNHLEVRAYYGGSLATGDVFGDGADDLAVGAPGRDLGVEDAGQIHIRIGESGIGIVNGQWTLDLSFVGQTAAENDAFGSALAMGDFNDDGYADVAVGVEGRAVAGHDGAGALAIIEGSMSAPVAGTLVHQATEGVVGSPGLDDHFGAALAVGNFDGGGLDLAVGIPGETVAGHAAAGAVQRLRNKTIFVSGFEDGFSGWETGTNENQH